jgi:glutamyl-tRNA synthetase
MLRPNLSRVSDFADWLEVLHGDIDAPELNHEERTVVREAAAAAGALDWSGDPWKQLADQVKGVTGQKGRALFHPLRLAITGRDSGPEMAGLVEVIGKERVVRRLEAAAKR